MCLQCGKAAEGLRFKNGAHFAAEAEQLRAIIRERNALAEYVS